jgi:hypothetical protein
MAEEVEAAGETVEDVLPVAEVEKAEALQDVDG